MRLFIGVSSIESNDLYWFPHNGQDHPRVWKKQTEPWAKCFIFSKIRCRTTGCCISNVLNTSESAFGRWLGWGREGCICVASPIMDRSIAASLRLILLVTWPGRLAWTSILYLLSRFMRCELSLSNYLMTWIENDFFLLNFFSRAEALFASFKINHLLQFLVYKRFCTD